MFSPWAKWEERPQTTFPGIYMLAFSETEISGEEFSIRKEIIYIGMTNAVGGLKSRLAQLEATLKGKEGHGGARRIRRVHKDYDCLKTHLYVSVCPHEFNVGEDSASQRKMGEVAKHEYDSLADYVESFHELPVFNDKNRSPKDISGG